MAAQVLSFFQRSPRHAPKPADWSQQELAEFYRVESALIRAGIRVGTDRGMSDENEPWFCFYRADDGEVVIHFARIDGEYVIAGPAYEEIARGFDFSGLVRNMVARHPLIRRGEGGSNISVHPAALLVAVVGTAFFKTGEARAAESGAGASGGTGAHRPALLTSSSAGAVKAGAAPMAVALPTYDTAQLPANQAVLILAAALLASDYRAETSSLDPAAQAAIAATAASLDFGPAGSAPRGGAEGFSLSGATHAAPTPDNTPAQAVGSVLSLVTLLSTLPEAWERSAAAEALATAAGPDDHAPLVAPAANDDGAWALDVRLGLSGAGLPSVEAVQLVRAVVGDGAAAQKISVIEVDKLPAILADLIAKGDHRIVTQTPAETHAEPTPAQPTTPETPKPPPSAADPDASTGGGQLPPPETPRDPAPADPKPAPHDPAPTYASPALVKQFIDYFIAHTPGVDVMVKGSEVVMFDTRVLHDVGAIGQLDSMTFHFDDGSAISLVGDHSSFLMGHVLV